MKTLKEIRARLAEIKPDIETLGAAEELSTEDETRLSDLITEWDELTEKAKPLEERARKIEEIRAAQAKPGATEDGDGATGGVQVMRKVDAFETGDDPVRMTRGEARDKALKALESRDLTGHLPDSEKERLEGLLRARTRNTQGDLIARRLLVTESEAYRSAFMKLSTSPTPVLDADEGRAIQQFQEFRASMNITTDGQGGFGVPVLIDPTIILTAQGSPNPFFAISRVETITNDEWKGVSSAGVTWSFDAESAEVSDDSPTIAQPTVKAHKAQGFIPYTIEVGMDYPGFAEEMSKLLASGYAELLVSAFTVGTGTNQPFGIVTALDGTSSEIDTATTDTLVAADVNGLYTALPVRYRANATWMSHTGVNTSVQVLGSASDSSFTVDWTAEGVSTLRGRRYVTNDYMNGTPNSNVTPFLIFGDFSNYLIAQRAGMSVELVPHMFATANNRPNGERAWYAWARVGADSINDAGFRALSDNGS